MVAPEPGATNALLMELEASTITDAAPLTQTMSLSELCIDPGSTVQHYTRVLSETFLLFRLAVTLWTFLGLGWRWTLNFCRLVLYAFLLLPGFTQMVIFYFFSSRVVRSIPYGRQARQRLDLYFPMQRSPSSKLPVVIYVTGGAWTIGYKAWGALLARRMSQQNVIVACLDYKNFPQGDAPQMLEDVNTGILWVCERIGKYGGDPNNITLVGQSAGAHLGALALIKQAAQAAGVDSRFGVCPVWSPSSLRAFVGVSGAYDLDSLSEHLHRRGLYRGLFARIMSLDGRPAYRELSPVYEASTLSAAAARQLPPVFLMHGTIDKSVPYEGSIHLNAALQNVGVRSSCRIFEGKSHTSFLIEDPMRGGRDLLMDVILEVVTGVEQSHTYASLCPKVLCDLAGWVCPF